jgi:hypothetical protein
MLRDTHSYATLLEGFLKEVLMDNDFSNANSGCIHLSEHVDKTLEAYLVSTYVNSYEVWKEECIREFLLIAAQSAPQLMQGPAAKKNKQMDG